MTLAETIYRHSLKLPEPVAREALDFIEFLEQRHGIATAETTSRPPTAKPNRRPGSAKGKLTILADDNRHLDDFEDYMH
ncbi:MAG TPA: DUF2281 domain-containing protein [Rhodocyclaceae bacterium]|nr:DUF2281 domain-containing protein [Rhodocyclaceae bacterium]